MSFGEKRLKVVVTGASGFIGSQVLGLLQEYSQVEVVPVTRRQIPDWCCVTDYAQSPVGDVLIHLAENSNRMVVDNLAARYEKDVMETLSTLLTKGYGQIVYVSSAVLYGDEDNQPRSTSDQVVVNDTYTRVKRQAELAVLDTAVGRVVRLANVYGVGMSKHNVISAIIRQIPGIGSLKVIDSSPIRDFINVNDVAEGILNVALKHNRRQDAFRIYNIGTGIGTSIELVARMALKIAGQFDRQIEAKYPIDNKKQSCLVLDRAQMLQDFEWEPKITLNQGLAELLQKKEKCIL
jgi:UDP-glucose 4-epimerase